jgi:hypothetical protein
MLPSPQEIGAVLGFSIDELALNRARVASSRQLWHVTSTALAGALITVSMTAFIVTLCALNWKTMPPALSVMPVVCSVGGLFASGVLIRDTLANVVTREVSAAEGPLAFEAMGRGTAIVVGAFRGRAPERAMRVLTVGKAYRVYYLAHSDDFLSIEPIAPPESRTPP